MITQPKKVVAYIRVSTDQQELSLEVQQLKLQAFCQFHNLYPIKIFADEDTSGRKPLGERKQGGEMLEFLNKNKDITGVVALRVDRMFRNDVDGLTVADQWAEKGIDLYATDIAGNTVNVRTSHGRLMFTLMLSFAVFESMRIGERTQDAMSNLKRNKRKYSQDPLGFISDKDGTLKENPGEMNTVKEIISLSLEGYTLSYIARTLNERKYLSKRNKIWYGSTVKHVLKNSIYDDIRQEIFAERGLKKKVNKVNSYPKEVLSISNLLAEQKGELLQS
jgi:DNA invertase Pin-like site-specific DNA recombinase